MNRTDMEKRKHCESRVVKMCAQSTKISIFFSFTVSKRVPILSPVDFKKHVEDIAEIAHQMRG